MTRLKMALIPLVVRVFIDFKVAIRRAKVITTLRRLVTLWGIKNTPKFLVMTSTILDQF